jgi:adenylate cyclase
LERKLAAILAADVVGYSRLIGNDETGTLDLLRRLLKDVVEPTIARHHGRVVKLMGDGVLAEFGSVVDAVVAAVEIQEAVPQSSAHLAEDRRMALRVGVNLGDVVVEDGDLFGDGVNIAARLQEVASSGGVAVSDDVFRQLRGKLDLPFKDGGERSLKNIAEPVRTWLWTPAASTGAVARPEAPPKVSDKPSVAVLPFENMSGEAEQEYFADGMTEDIITGLSRFRSLFVIPRNSTISYKGRSPDPRNAARELGVRYIVEGSVRRGGDRIRVSGQLIDAENGGHLWAERFDSDLTDIFKVQDDVTNAIVAAIAPEIDKMERGRAERKPPDSLDAWSLYQRGLVAYHATTQESLARATELFDRVNDLDPSFAPAFAMAADARVRSYLFFAGDREVLDLAAEKARAGIALDAQDPVCHLADGRVNSFLGRHEIAIGRAKEAVRLNPSSSMTHHALGFVLARAGRSEEGIIHEERAVALGPRDIFLPGYLGFGAYMLFDLKRYEEALDWGRRGCNSVNTRPPNFACVVACLVLLNRNNEIAAALAEMKSRSSLYSIHEIGEQVTRSLPLRAETSTRFVEALRQAGVPE